MSKFVEAWKDECCDESEFHGSQSEVEAQAAMVNEISNEFGGIIKMLWI